MNVYVSTPEKQITIDVDIDETLDTLFKKIRSQTGSMIDVLTYEGHVLNDIHILENGATVHAGIEHLTEMEFLRSHKVSPWLHALYTTDPDVLSCLLELGCNDCSFGYSTKRYKDYMRVFWPFDEKSPHHEEINFFPGYITWTMEITQWFVQSKWFNMELFRHIMDNTKHDTQKWVVQFVHNLISDGDKLYITYKHPSVLGVLLSLEQSSDVSRYINMRFPQRMNISDFHSITRESFIMDSILELNQDQIKHIVKSPGVCTDLFASTLITICIINETVHSEFVFNLLSKFITVHHYMQSVLNLEEFILLIDARKPTYEQLQELTMSMEQIDSTALSHCEEVLDKIKQLQRQY